MKIEVDKKYLHIGANENVTVILKADKPGNWFVLFDPDKDLENAIEVSEHDLSTEIRRPSN